MIIIVIFLPAIFIIVGFINKKSGKIEFYLDKYGNYTGFNMKNKYKNADEAIADGCYVLDENHMFVGNENWDKFLSSSSEGKESKLRMVILSSKNDCKYIDFFYRKKLYYAFKSDSTILAAKGYKSLLSLKKEEVINNKVAYAIVLSDDDSITFHNISDDLLSSDEIKLDKTYQIIYFGIVSY